MCLYLVPFLRYSALIMAWPWNLGQRLVKVSEKSTVQKLGNYGPVLNHFQDKARYWSKIAIFFIPPVSGSSSEYFHKVWYEKYNGVATQWRESLRIWLYIRFDPIHEHDTYADGRTPHDGIGHIAYA